MPRWSVAIEVDVSFSALDEEAAEEKAIDIISDMKRQLLEKRPPGRRGGNARVYNVDAAGDFTVLPMEGME